MVTTGPNTSRFTISASGPGGRTMVGSYHDPGRLMRAPPVAISAPALRARSTKPDTRSSCSSETSGPMSVSAAAGSPTLSDSTAGTRSLTSLSWMRGPAMTRVAEVQSCPALKKPPILMPSITALRSASSKTMTGALPPSSRCTRLSVDAASRAMILPVAVSPVSETIATPGWRTRAAPTRSPAPVTTLNTPGGKISSSSISSARRRAVRGVHSDGFNTTVLPAARAGPIFQAVIISG